LTEPAEQPTPGQDPASGTQPAAESVATPAPAQPAPPAAVPAKVAPWDADLAERFPDEATRSAVSAYLGERVQPYVTQLEQSEVQANELLSDFHNAPKDTFLEIAQELIDAEAITPEDVTDYLATLTPAERAEGAQAQAPAQGPPQRDPEVQALLDERQAAQEKAAFDAEYAKVKETNPDVHFDYDLFLPVVADTGDFDQAVTKYQEKYGPYLEYAKQQAAAAAAAEASGAPAPPATLGNEAAGAGEVPTEKDYNGDVGLAIQDFFDEQRASNPTKPLAPPVPSG
jgi:hypothetical protein